MTEQKVVDKQWFVMSAIYGQELKIKEKLEELQIECFVPMKTTFSKEKGKVVKKTAPAIKNLIFVYVDKPTIQRVKVKYQYLQYQTHYVDGKRIPIIVPNDQMNNFVKAIKGNEEFIVYHSVIPSNTDNHKKVTITGGVFNGIRGNCVSMSGQRKNKYFIVVNNYTVELRGITPKMAVKCSN